MSKKTTGKKKNKNRSIVRKMWTVFAIFVALLVLLFVLIYNGVIGYMPPIDQLKNPTDKFASTIYSADGVEMGRYYRSRSNRIYVDFDEMSPHLTDALIATEDSRFDEHSGIDVKAIGRAIIKRVIMGQKSAGGGSTITQQLAKQLYSPESHNIFERALKKPVEWVIAVKLERYYTKDEIIKMYFNQFDFLNNAVGIKMASRVYFDKEPKDLNIQEAATLVGMCKNPSYYNPVRYTERTRQRRNVVFEQILGNILEPRIEGNHLGLSPFVILVSLSLWGWLWGFVGMILAVPMTVIIKIVCENFSILNPIAVLLGNGIARKTPQSKTTEAKAPLQEESTEEKLSK